MAYDFISADIISILLFVSPGFLTIALIGKFDGFAIRMEQFEKMSWSLIASVPIGIIFFYLNGIESLDIFFTYFISHPFISTLQILFFAVVLAIIVSIIIESNSLEKISQKIIFRKNPSMKTDELVWDLFMKENFNKAAIAKTHDAEYKGWLVNNSTRNEKREIVLANPVIVDTDNDGNTTDYPCGHYILLLEEEIKSIVILE